MRPTPASLGHACTGASALLPNLASAAPAWRASLALNARWAGPPGGLGEEFGGLFWGRGLSGTLEKLGCGPSGVLEH